jgi:hypothetical protein
MKVNFYKLIESAPNKTADLKANLVQLCDDLLQKGELLATDQKKVAQLRAKIIIEL